MATYSKRALLVNMFGTFGYITCLLLWMWVLMQYVPLVTDNERIMDFLIPPVDNSAPLPKPSEVSPVLAIFAFVITGVIMAIALFFLLRLPITIAQSGKKVTTKAATSIEPLVTRGRPLPQKKKRELTASLIKLIKLLLVIAPVLAGLLSILLPSLSLTYEIIILVTGILGVLSVFWFTVQYISADILGVKPDKLV